MIIRHARQTLIDITSKFFFSMVNIYVCTGLDLRNEK